MTKYNFCPHCGSKIVPEGSSPAHCHQCGATYYQNAKPCASVLPVRDGKVLLAKRGRDPYKGAYDIIGGFMEADELPEAAALREAKEETGLDMRIVSLLGIYNDEYGDDGERTLSLHYITEITGGEMNAMDDAAELRWFDIGRVPLNESFQNTTDGLRDLQKWHAAQSADKPIAQQI